MATMKADIIIEEQRNAMQEAYAMAPQMKGRYLRNRSTKNCFTWTPQLHVSGEFELMPEGFEPDGAPVAEEASEEKPKRGRGKNAKVEPEGGAEGDTE